MLTEVIDQLKARDENTTRVVFDFHDLKFSADDKQGGLIEGKNFAGPLTNSGFENLANVLDVPITYLKKTPPELREMTINYWLQNKKASYSALVEGENIRGFMNPAYCYIPTSKVFEAATEGIEDMSIGNYSVGSDAVELIAFSEPFETNVKDSLVRAGIRFLHSDTWNLFPRFDSYLCRIACLNSTLAPLAHKKFRVANKSESEVLDQVRGFVKDSLDQIPLMIQGFGELADETVDNFVGVITNICHKNKIPKKIKNILIETSRSPLFLSTISHTSITNLYDLVNLFTYVATHIDGARTHREQLMMIAGNLMLNKSDTCSTCGNEIH